MDLTQTVLLAVLIVLTIFLVVIGFQVFFTLKDFRKTLWRVNKLLDNTDDLVGQIKKPVESAGNLFSSLVAGVGIAHFLKREKSDQKEQKGRKD